MDLGSLPNCPDWLFKLFFWLAMLGAAAVGIGLIAGLLWLISHLRWV